MPNIGAPELIIILIVALIVVGPGKLPDVGSALGKSIREFRKAATDVRETASLEPAPAAQAAAAASAAAATAPTAPPTPPIAPLAAATPLDAPAPPPAPTPVAAAVATDVTATVAEASTPAAQPPTPDA